MLKTLPDITSLTSFTSRFCIYVGLPTYPRNVKIMADGLYEMLEDTSSLYNAFSIPKHHNNEYRTVFRVDYKLAECQKFIRMKILNPLDEKYTSPYAYAYRKGISIADNAKVHEGCRYMLKLDIRHFFESTRQSLVYEMFRKYTPYNKSVLGLLTRIVCYKGALCQGACTSPQIVNLILADFDHNVGNLCNAIGVHYTRYCDDMIFSSDTYFPHVLLTNFVRGELKHYHYHLNEKKTRFLRPGARKTVTGAVVNDRVRACREYRKKVRQELYYMEKYGVKNHLDYARPSWYSGRGTDYELGHAVASLKGRIGFIAMLDPDEKFLEQAQISLRNIQLNLREFCLNREPKDFVDLLPGFDLKKILSDPDYVEDLIFFPELPNESLYWEDPIMTDDIVPSPGDDDAPEDFLSFGIDGEGNDPF